MARKRRNNSFHNIFFEVGFLNYFTEMITILKGYVARNIWVATLKVKDTA